MALLSRVLGRIDLARNTSSRIAVAPLILLLSPGYAAAAGRTADQVSGSFNQTGRAMSMTVPLVDNGRTLGDVALRVGRDDSITVSKWSLLVVLGRDGAPATLAVLNREPSEFLLLERLVEIGIDIRFDQRNVLLVMGLRPEQRKSGDISLAPPAEPTSRQMATPASVSGYVNVFSEAGYFWAQNQTAFRLDLEAALRASGIVFETELSIENNVNPLLCPTGALCLFNHASGVKRRGTRAVYDFVDWQSRLILGDAHARTTTFQRGPDVAGVSVEHFSEKFDPGHAIRATGTQSFSLERSANVDVLINGAIAQHLQLTPGTYNLRDLPLRSGANEITLLITDENGTSRTLIFNTYSAQSLLGVGKTEWALTGGAPSFLHDGELSYASDRFFGTGLYRYGLTNTMTVEGHAQSDNDVLMGGGGVTLATGFGVFSLNAAGSLAKGGTGVGGATRLSWDISNKDNKDALRLTAEVHTDGFRTPGQLQFAPTGAIYPTYEYKHSFSGSYTRALAAKWRGTITARYDISNPTFVTSNPLIVRGDRYHVDLSLSHQFSEGATISGIVGLSNEFYNRGVSTATEIGDTKADIWAGLRLYWRPTPKVTVTTTTDTLNQWSTAAGSYQSSTGINAWSTYVAITDDRFSKRMSASSEVRYQGQRGEVSVGQDVADSLSATARARTPDEARTRLRLGTAFVFADNTSAISAPVRGDGGFAILTPHSSIGTHTVTAGSTDNVRAKSDALGPAVVSGLSAYSQQNLPVDVSDLPIGYSLGQSGFDLKPQYKTGYKLEIGSDYSVSALGQLLDRQGAPLELASGMATNRVKHVMVFTNRAGKFAADGLGPGQWTLTIESEDGKFVYLISIHDGAKGLVRLGSLRPLGD